MSVSTNITISSSPDVALQVHDWLVDHWDPNLSVAEWWELLGLAGWAAPSLPTNAFGHGVSRSDAVLVQQAVAGFGAVGAPAGLGLLLAAPTIATHGTQEQIDTYVRDIVTGQRSWCQLFSEPGAGSDLAGLTSRAVQDGDAWVVNGQKVWTSMGQTADLGMLLARTNQDAPKHGGITWFACDMHQSGVDVRPLRELTGHAMFNEVFLTDASVDSGSVIGRVNGGWEVANTTLAFERAGLGAGGGDGSGLLVAPGTIAGNLSRRVGDFVPESAGPRDKRSGSAGAPRPARSSAANLISIAQSSDRSRDPLVRQGLVRLHVLGDIGRLNNERLRAVRAAGRDIPGMPNISKLSMSAIMRLQRDVGLSVLGAHGMLHSYTEDQRTLLAAEGHDARFPGVTTMALYAQAPPIYGGTDQIQLNIIGERVLGLPKEPGSRSDVPFSSLPKNG